jgi:hypothetical protein
VTKHEDKTKTYVYLPISLTSTEHITKEGTLWWRC